MNPFVSVVSSAFNAESHLRQSLDSILKQEGVDFEFIIVDDGSTDNTAEILRWYAQRDKRIHVVSQSNQGLTKALIVGCAKARGKYIARHDVDDVSLPERLQKQYQYLENNPEVSFVSCQAQAVGPYGEPLYQIRGADSATIATENLKAFRQGVAGHGSVMVRKSDYDAVGGYRWQFYFAQDLDLWLRLTNIGLLSFVPEVLYQFRFDGNAISGKYRKAQVELAGILRQLHSQPRHEENQLLAAAAEVRPGNLSICAVDKSAGQYFIASCLLGNRDPRARYYFWKSIALRPLQIKSYIGLCKVFTIYRKRPGVSKYFNSEG